MNKQKADDTWVRNPDASEENPIGTTGFTWNPITGCMQGCGYCYARHIANEGKRDDYLANTNIILPAEHVNRQQALTDPFYPRFWSARLGQPLESKKPAGVLSATWGSCLVIGYPENYRIVCLM